MFKAHASLGLMYPGEYICTYYMLGAGFGLNRNNVVVNFQKMCVIKFKYVKKIIVLPILRGAVKSKPK